VHTLKGDAAAVGFRELSELAHELEDALAVDSAQAHQSLAEIAFRAADAFAAMLDAYRKGTKLPSADPLRKMVRNLGQPPKSKPAPLRKKKAQTPASPWAEYENLAAQDAAARGEHVYQIWAAVDPGCAMPIAARQLLLSAMAEVGEVLATRPEPGSTANTNELQVLLASEETGDRITRKCQIPAAISQVKLKTVATPTAKAAKNKSPEIPLPAATAVSIPDELPAAAPEHPAPEHDTGAKVPHAPAESTLRVDAERIDNVLNLVGELIIGKSMLQQALTEFSAQSPQDPMRSRFSDAMAFQSRVLNDLQRAVMKVRMVPVEQLFRRFPRMVRDVAKQCEKEVEVVLRGQDTDLDKSLLDTIAEPLTHLVRNAVGHGIESTEERTRRGKPARGTVCLDAYHQANQVIVEISDDGQGIDVQKIRTAAVERELLSPEAAARASEADLLQLIFQPGFSTANEITEVAGRGVGLDVVQTVLHRLKGTVQLETHVGQGTRFRLRLPLTLAIIKALLFRVRQRLYAIPLNAVAEIARARESDLHLVDNREVLQLRNYVLPVIRLAGRSPEQAQQKDTRIFILVMAVGERRYGLLVDSLNGEEELVIKPLSDHTVETDLVSGASILGDGRVVLILNLSAVADRFAKWRPAPGSAAACAFSLSHTDGPWLSRGTEAHS
jgi:two-component system chemotaxis sensor kinase CheA